MSATNGHRAAPTGPAELRAEIAQTRVKLGETVSALAAKVDVKARAQEKAGQLRGQLAARARDAAGGLTARLGEGARWPMLGAVAALTLLLIGLAGRRRRD
jgi:hypothetical protein